MSLSHFERELAWEIARRAQISGWSKAIDSASKEYKVKPLVIGLLMSEAAEYNEKADPAGRIDELDGYETRSTEAPETAPDRDG